MAITAGASATLLVTTAALTGTSAPFNVTAGQCIVVCAAQGGNALVFNNPTDSQGNTYVLQITGLSSGYQIAFWTTFASATATGVTVTLTKTGTAGLYAAWIQTYSGVSMVGSTTPVSTAGSSASLTTLPLVVSNGDWVVGSVWTNAAPATANIVFTSPSVTRTTGITWGGASCLAIGDVAATATGNTQVTFTNNGTNYFSRTALQLVAAPGPRPVLQQQTSYVNNGSATITTQNSLVFQINPGDMVVMITANAGTSVAYTVTDNLSNPYDLLSATTVAGATYTLGVWVSLTPSPAQSAIITVARTSVAPQGAIGAVIQCYSGIANVGPVSAQSAASTTTPAVSPSLNIPPNGVLVGGFVTSANTTFAGVAPTALRQQIVWVAGNLSALALGDVTATAFGALSAQLSHTGVSVASISLQLLQNIVLNSTALPNGTVGQAYNFVIPVLGGQAPYVGVLGSGSNPLPSGISFGPANNSGVALTGTPTTPGTYNFTIIADDSGSLFTPAIPFTMTVAGGALTVPAQSLPNGTQGIAYPATTITVTGGTPPYTPSVTSGTLPPGLSFGTPTTSGVPITGTPTTPGIYNFTLHVTDAASGSASQALSIDVLAAFVITQPAGESSTIYVQQGNNQFTGFQLGWTSGVTPVPVTFNATGLPAGVTATFTPNPTSTSTQLTIFAPVGTPVGTTPFTVSASGGAYNNTYAMTLVVQSATVGFSLAASPSSLSLGLCQSNLNSTVTVTYVGGFSGPVTLAASGLPPGVSAVISPNPTTTTATVSFSANGNAHVGPATVTIQGTSAGAPLASTTIALNVYQVTVGTAFPITSIASGGTYSNVSGGGQVVILTTTVPFGSADEFEVTGLTHNTALNGGIYFVGSDATADYNAVVGSTTISINVPHAIAFTLVPGAETGNVTLTQSGCMIGGQVATSMIQTSMTVSGNQFRMQRIKENSAQTFLAGTPLQLTTGFLSAWNGTTLTDGIAGISAEFGANLATPGVPRQQTFGSVPFQPAAGNFSRPLFNDGMTGVYVATQDTVFSGQVGPSQTTAQSDIGTQYGLTIDTDGHWYVDKTKTGASAVVQVVGLDTYDTLRGVRFVIIPTAAQILA